MSDIKMVAARKRDIFFGTSTDLDMDYTEVKALDMADLDGSQNVRMVSRWTAGVTVGVAANCVIQS